MGTEQGMGTAYAKLEAAAAFGAARHRICMPNLQDSFIILHTDEPLGRSQTLSSGRV